MSDGPASFRIRAILGLAIAAIVLLTPFAVNNFIQGRWLLGLGSLTIVAVLAVAAWLMREGGYSERIATLLLAPAILVFLSLSIQNQGIIGVLWSYPAVMAFYILFGERRAIAANVVLYLVVVPQAWFVLEPGLALRIASTLAAVAVFAGIFVHAITEAQRQLEEMAITDPLTRLHNRTTLYDALTEAAERQRRSRTPMTLLAVDLDHFKTINDSFGHAAGDSVLVKLSQLLRERLRRVDRVFRTGGEEFLVLLNDTAAKAGAAVAEELRQHIEKSDVCRHRPVTVSIGVATLRPGEEVDVWMRRADESLYAAKQQGRNRVVSSAME